MRLFLYLEEKTIQVAWYAWDLENMIIVWIVKALFS